MSITPEKVAEAHAILAATFSPEKHAELQRIAVELLPELLDEYEYGNRLLFAHERMRSALRRIVEIGDVPEVAQSIAEEALR